MKKIITLGASILFLGGCALPVPIQIASWALDGISYLATEKSVADHGLSMVAQQDCAVLRGLLSEGDFCRDFKDSTTVLVDNGSGKSTSDSRNGLVEDGGTEVASLSEIESLANFETASGGENGDVKAGAGVASAQHQKDIAEIAWPMDLDDNFRLPGYPLEISVIEGPAPEVSAPDEFAFSFRLAIDEWQTQASAMAAKEIAPMAAQADSKVGEPAVGLYFVIGSFRQHKNARDLRQQFQALAPSVFSAKLKRGTLYRVVVGPFGQRDAKEVHRSIFKAGIADSWAIRIEPGQWSMAMVDPPALKAGTVVLVSGLSRQKYQPSTFEFIQQQLAALVY